jgi:YidC/Oxa1 family membrane protein insertase
MLELANIFQPLIDVFESVLKFFHNSLGLEWGWSIVLLTVCVRAVLLPLTIKQFSSMQRMQQLAPEMKSIQAKYKDDKERQQQEMMKFYKENGVNPLASCLPLAAQLPVFISLYYMLRQSLRFDICPQVQKAFQASYAAAHHVSLAQASGQTTACGPHGGASFLFIPDLTNKATGGVLVVLIILYVGTQLASSLMMANPTMDPTQRKLMLALPLVFVLFVIRFPAGVMVYWITTNTWTMGQQYIIRRRIGPVRPAPAAEAAGGSRTSVVATDKSLPASDSKSDANGKGDGNAKGDANGKSDTNGSGSGGLSGLIRGRSKAGKEAAPVATPARTGPPPRPPRKKKKRSGRRR